MELLANMWELCPADQHSNIFFAVLFLQRLPRDIRVLLNHEDHGNLHLLAAKADQLVAFGGRTDTVAAATAAADYKTAWWLPYPARTSTTSTSATTSSRRSCHRQCPRGQARTSTRQLRRRWLGAQPASSTTTGVTATRPTTVQPPALGRETSKLGCRCCYPPWQASTRDRQQQWRLFPSGHRIIIQYHSAFFSSTSYRPSPPLSKRPADLVLG